MVDLCLVRTMSYDEYNALLKGKTIQPKDKPPDSSYKDQDYICFFKQADHHYIQLYYNQSSDKTVYFHLKDKTKAHIVRKPFLSCEGDAETQLINTYPDRFTDNGDGSYTIYLDEIELPYYNLDILEPVQVHNTLDIMNKLTRSNTLQL